MIIKRDGADIELREIPGFPHIYMAGSDGKIYSFNVVNANANKVMPFAVGGSLGVVGYRICRLFFDGKGITKTVHSLVCAAFHGPRPWPKAQVRHLDGNKLNNLPDNLAWGSQIDNEADKLAHGRLPQGESHYRTKIDEEAVRRIRIASGDGERTCDLAARFDLNESTIRGIVKRTRWAHVL